MTWPAEVFEDILDRISLGESLRSICEGGDMPSRETFMRRVRDSPEFEAKYARAMVWRTEARLEEMDDIADDGRNDYMERLGPDGESKGYVVNGEAVARSKLRLEQRRWFAEKLLPKKYGARQQIEHSGTLTLSDRMKRAEDKADGKP